MTTKKTTGLYNTKPIKEEAICTMALSTSEACSDYSKSRKQLRRGNSTQIAVHHKSDFDYRTVHPQHPWRLTNRGTKR